MQRVLIDFETYFEQDYTLKKLSTSEYVRDPRFKIHGAAIRTSAETTAKWLHGDALKHFVGKLDPAGTCIIAHHTQFDGFILREHFGFVPARYFCTRAASRYIFQGSLKAHDLGLLSEVFKLPTKQSDVLMRCKGIKDLSATQLAELGQYAIGDADNTWVIASKLEPLIPQLELDTIDLTMRMFCDPVLRVDVPRAQAAQKKEIEDNARIIAECGVDLATLRSDDKLASYMTDLGIEVPYKITPKGNRKPAFAKNDEAFKELLESSDPITATLANARLIAKSTSQATRAERLINAGTTGDHTLPIYYHFHRAQTGRFSGGNKMNVQNFVAGSELRKSIKAPPGYVVCAADSGQIECRAIAWLADEHWILDAFRDKRDLYCELANDIYGRTITKNDVTERFVGKTGMLGLQYSMGAAKFQKTLAAGIRGAPVIRMPILECQRVVDVYRAKCNNIQRYWYVCDAMITHLAGQSGRIELGKCVIDAAAQTIQLPSGRSLVYWNMQLNADTQKFEYRRGKTWCSIYGAKKAENIVQAISRDIIVWQMRNINVRYRVVMMTHDEIICLIPENEAKEGSAWVTNEMTKAPSWCADIPLAAEAKYAAYYPK